MNRGFVNVPLMVFITCLVVVGGVFYLIGRGSVEPNQSILPQPSATVSGTINNVMNASSSPLLEWKSIEVKDISSNWLPLTVSYPESWNATKETYSEPSGFTLTLSKGSNKIIISQGPMDGGECVYNNEKVEGQSSQYTNKKEINQNGAVWRRSQLTDMSFGPDRYTVCAKSAGQSHFMSLTRIGAIRIETPGSDSNILMEVDQILEKISY